VFELADIKATSFRISEEDIAKFKEFADKEGYNQAEAFKSIMQTVEMAKAKNMIKDRAKEIEVFQDTINNLMNMFLNSLNVNQTSEERIREELSQELQTKDNTISTMYEQLQETKADNKNLKENNKDLNDNIKAINEEVKRLANDIIDKQKNIDKLNSNNDLLQEQLKEYKQYKDDYKKLNNHLEQLKTEYEEVKENNNKLSTANELLNNKISTHNDMLEFYKNEIENKSKSIEEYKSEIKLLETKYNKQIEEVKAEHETILNEKLKNSMDNLNSKHEVELGKKDLEIEKLNNILEQLQNKTKRKPVHQENIQGKTKA
jgi:chromosome segregation ATPase